ncbi:hypothetical protein PsorP6_008967 [Peronosclerospora sorghi]|uniref:Uncharacterized protein n=1 Tax=Peronosclerospora sorghi TaxID=230839 RepID=A0ACC0VZN8_9STRA|nr:hypothetical protein PsorP6_008967 [Peronosclerospora sorghi]
MICCGLPQLLCYMVPTTTTLLRLHFYSVLCLPALILGCLLPGRTAGDGATFLCMALPSDVNMSAVNPWGNSFVNSFKFRDISFVGSLQLES